MPVISLFFGEKLLVNPFFDVWSNVEIFLKLLSNYGITGQWRRESFCSLFFFLRGNDFFRMEEEGIIASKLGRINFERWFRIILRYV